MRVIAVDWSGAKRHARRKIWLAEVAADQLVDLRNGWTRESLTEHLIAKADRDPRMIVGLDFAFSFPAWFVAQQEYWTVRDVWAACERHGDGVAAHMSRPPFWYTRCAGGAGLRLAKCASGHSGR
jgi:hypothetical protein